MLNIYTNRTRQPETLCSEARKVGNFSRPSPTLENTQVVPVICKETSNLSLDFSGTLDPHSLKGKQLRKQQHFLKTSRIPLAAMLLFSVCQTGPCAIGVALFGLPVSCLLGPLAMLVLTAGVCLFVKSQIRSNSQLVGKVDFSKLTFGSFAPGLWAASAIGFVGVGIASLAASPLLSVLIYANIAIVGLALIATFFLYVDHKYFQVINTI